MIVSPPDRMNYFKGVLLLYQKKIDDRDPLEEYIKKFVNILRFDSEFCEFTVRDIISNLPAIDEPPHFLQDKVVPCVLVVMWPNLKPLKVPIDAFKLGGEPSPLNTAGWTPEAKEEMKKIMKDWPRDSKGRWMKEGSVINATN